MGQPRYHCRGKSGGRGSLPTDFDRMPLECAQRPPLLSPTTWFICVVLLCIILCCAAVRLV